MTDPAPGPDSESKSASPSPSSASISSASGPESGGFGLSTATYIIISCMVGVGILTTSGYTVAELGSNQLMIGLWLIGGVLALCGALSEAELAAALPHSGGDYIFIREAYGKLAGFVVGWMTLVIGFGAPIALSALTSASYWLAAFRGSGEAPDLYAKFLASTIVMTLAIYHCAGRRQTARLQAVTTWAVLGLLGAFVICGLAIGARHFPERVNDRPPLTADLVQSMLFSLIYINYGYAGWNSAAYLTSEVRNPRRNLPLAILIGTAIVTLLYLAINLTYALAIPANEIVKLKETDPNSVRPIAELAAVRLFGAKVGAVISAATGLILVSMVSGFIVAGARVTQAMAQRREFPAVAGMASRTGAPIFATLVLAALAFGLIWIPKFRDVLVYASLGLALCSMLSVSAVFTLRWRQPNLERPYRTPGYPFTPLIYLIGTGALAGATVVNDRGTVIAAALTIGLGIALYGVWTWWLSWAEKSKTSGSDLI